MNAETRKRVGLALGGGVVRGLAHVGVISALEEAGIKPDYMAGTSAGSIITVLYCAGISAAQIRTFATRLQWWNIARPVWPNHGLLSLDRLARWLKQTIGDIEFSDLQIPCAVVATDIRSGEKATLTSGRVIPAILASCSVPGLVAPFELNGRLLCDGGIIDMLPVLTLRELGAEYVIGVDIFTFKFRPNLGPAGYILAAMEILLERAGGGTDYADCLISPQLQGETYINFFKRMKLFELGRQAALEKLPCIQREISSNAQKVMGSR